MAWTIRFPVHPIVVEKVPMPPIGNAAARLRIGQVQVGEDTAQVCFAMAQVCFAMAQVCFAMAQVCFVTVPV
jgi:hypothetical protein